MKYLKSIFSSREFTEDEIQEIEDMFQYYIDDEFIKKINKHH
jgi:hypothetical protein